MFDDDTSVLPLLRGGEPALLVAKVTEGEEATVEAALAAMEAAGATEDDKERASKARHNFCVFVFLCVFFHPNS